MLNSAARNGYLKQFQNGIATAIATLHEIRQSPLKNPDKYQKDLIVVQQLIPEIRRALIYLANTEQKSIDSL